MTFLDGVEALAYVPISMVPYPVSNNDGGLIVLIRIARTVDVGS